MILSEPETTRAAVGAMGMVSRLVAKGAGGGGTACGTMGVVLARAGKILAAAAGGGAAKVAAAGKGTG